MPAKFLPAIAVALLALLGLACNNDDSNKDPAPKPAAIPIPRPSLPPEVRGTIAEHAVLVSGGYQAVDGYCLVAGLGKNGSSEVPPTIEKYLVDYLRVRKLGWEMYGTKDFSPIKIIRDKDTAVVRIVGEIPPGAQRGTHFDLMVSALPQTQTRTLDGGTLMPAELFPALGGVPGGAGRKAIALGKGPVLVNPFLDPSKPEDQAKTRAGRVVGGGIMLEDRPIQLQLYEPDYGRTHRIKERINERFPSRKPVAEGKNNQVVSLTVPPEYEKDVEHFTQLVMHLPLVASGGEFDQMAKNVAKMMELPTARHEDLSLVWEAMGTQIQPFVRSCYASTNPDTAFYAARAGLRMGDSTAEDIVLNAAKSGKPRLRLAAIAELARHPQLYQASQILRKLIDDDNQEIRLAAYEAMRLRGDPTILTLQAEDFVIDLVPCNREYVVYASQSGSPRIALFGKTMPVSSPLFYCAPDDLVTVNVNAGEKQLKMQRLVPRSGKHSEWFKVDPTVSQMLLTMGLPAEKNLDGSVSGMGMTYGQVVSTVGRMCNAGCIPAKFVLQPMPDVQNILGDSMGAGRPDIAGD